MICRFGHAWDWAITGRRRICFSILAGYYEEEELLGECLNCGKKDVSWQ